MKRAINIFLILAGAALIMYVIVLASAKNNTNGANANRKPEAKTEEPSVKIARVKVAVVHPQPMMEYLLLPGTVEAWEDIDLSAKIGGIIEWIGPQEGTHVTSGEMVIRLDVASKVALFNQAKAQLAQAEKQYERVSKLVRDHVVTQADLDNATTQRDVARAAREVTEVALKDATLHSPIDGVVDRIPVDVGEHVNAGQLVAKIVQADRVKIVVNVPEKDVRYCTRGQEAGVFCGEVRLDQMVKGKIYYVALTADPITRTYRIQIEMDNRKGQVRPGMIVRVGLIRRQIENALAAPLYAVVDRGDRKVIFVEKDGRAVQHDVTLGILDAEKVQVTQGLAEGERLIVVGHRDLVNGEPVEVEGITP